MINVSIDTFAIGVFIMNEVIRIESELEVKTYLDRLKYAIKNGAEVKFQISRHVDTNRDLKFTNQYTVSTLFPDENPVEALKRELLTLTTENYIQTVKDLSFPERSEMRVFGKTYNKTDDVYIKIRVELLGEYGNTTTFVMSFHFAERALSANQYPYRIA